MTRSLKASLEVVGEAFGVRVKRSRLGNVCAGPTEAQAKRRQRHTRKDFEGEKVLNVNFKACKYKRGGAHDNLVREQDAEFQCDTFFCQVQQSYTHFE